MTAWSRRRTSLWLGWFPAVLLLIVLASVTMATFERRVQQARARQVTGPRPRVVEGEGQAAATAAGITRTDTYSKDDAERSMGQLEDALRQAPGHWVLWYNRGNAYLALERWDEAIADYSQALQLNGRDAWVYVNRGLAYQKRGDLEKALADQDTAVRLAPLLANAYANRGWTRIYLGQPDEAMPDFERAVGLEPDNLLPRNGLGTVYVLTGRTQQAIDEFTHALTFQAPDGREEEYEALRGEIYNNRAAAYFNLGAYEKSRDDVQQAKIRGVTPAPALIERLERATWDAPIGGN